MEAADYEEFGPMIEKHKLVIAALRHNAGATNALSATTAAAQSETDRADANALSCAAFANTLRNIVRNTNDENTRVVAQSTLEMPWATKDIHGWPSDEPPLATPSPLPAPGDCSACDLPDRGKRTVSSRPAKLPQDGDRTGTRLLRQQYDRYGFSGTGWEIRER